MNAFETTDPFSGMALIIMTIAGKSIAVRTERNTVLIKAALQASIRKIISIGVTDPNRAQGVEILMHIFKDLIKTLPRIPEEFTDLERWESFAQILQTRDGQQVIIAVGRSAGTRQRPDQKEAVIHDVEGFGFVSEMMFSARSGLVFFFFGGIGVDLAGLVGAGVIIIPRIWKSRGIGKTS